MSAAGFACSGLSRWFAASLSMPAAEGGAPATGLANLLSSRLMLVSMRSHAYCALFALALPFAPMAIAYGKKTPFTSL